MPKMSDIKITISNLCKLLNLIFDMKIKPETFRLAKFNKSSDDIVETFWILLSNMIDLATSEEIVLNVKRHFLVNLKYKSLQFYTLPEAMSYGSRELLLAFAFLLSQDYLNKCIKTMINNSLLNPYYQPKMDNPQCKGENYSFNIKLIKSDDDYENALKWIEGRINYNRKIFSEYQTCFEKLSTKLCKRNLVSHTEQLSIPAMLALNSAEHGKRFLENTEMVSKIVENHERWLKTQSNFWEWMNSVLLERQKNLHVISSEELDKFVTALE